MLPMYPAKTNSPITTLASAISGSATIIPLNNADAVPDAPNVCTIGLGENAETIYYGTKDGNNLTDVVRGFQGTQKAWDEGITVARFITAYDLDTLRDNLILHSNDDKPHIFHDADAGKNYKYGIKLEGGSVVFMYEEVS